MGDYDESAGQQGVVIMPSNTSLILADSRHRENADTEEPADFICNVSSAIAVKEIYYRLLAWNQPVFAHNNTNNEVRFQLAETNLNPVSADVFVCYASPFQSFRDFDGNPIGSVYQPPQGYSYAYQMETAFNWDCRLLQSNLTPLPHPYINANPLQTVYVTFRYNPSRGFAIQANLYDYATQTFGAPVAILLLPCSWVQNAHYVHGFGVFTPNGSASTDSSFNFVPMSQGPQYTINCNDTPNLMPSRYVVVQSPELTKDRRTTSFHSSELSGFTNELAILPLLVQNTCLYHTNEVADDSTVISLRTAYQPSKFRITMKDETGEIYHCDDPIGKLLNTPGYLTKADVQSIMSSASTNVYRGRGNSNVINYLVFGKTYEIPSTGAGSFNGPYMTFQINPTSAQSYTFISDYNTFNGSFANPFTRGPADPPYGNTNFANFGAIVSTLTTNFYAPSVGIAPQAAPFFYAGTLSPATQQSAIYSFNPKLTMNPRMSSDLKWNVTVGSTDPTDLPVRLFLVMLAPTENRVYGYWGPGASFSPWNGSGQFGYTPDNFTPNPKYVAAGLFNNTTNLLFRMGAGVWWETNINTTGHNTTVRLQGRFNPGLTWFYGANFVVQTVYFPPADNENDADTNLAYPFGNTAAKMLCEDVIHELTGVIEYN